MFLIVFASFGFLLLFPPSVTIFISLRINPSPALIVFGNSDVYHKGWKLSFHLVKLTNLVNAAIILLSKTTLLRWLTFLLGSLTVTLDNLALLDFFFLLTLVFALMWLSLHWKILIILFSQFPWTFFKL